MTNVVTLDGLPKPEFGAPDEGLIACIEDLLERAKSGRLQSFVGTGWTSDGLRCTLLYDTHDDTYQMLGALAWLQAEYISRHTSPLG